MIDPFGFGRWRVLQHVKRTKARQRRRRHRVDDGAAPVVTADRPVTARDIVQPMAVRLLQPRPVGTCLASFDQLAARKRPPAPAARVGSSMPAIPAGLVPTVIIGTGPNKPFTDVRAADPALDRWDRMPLAFALALIEGAHAQV